MGYRDPKREFVSKRLGWSRKLDLRLKTRSGERFVLEGPVLQCWVTVERERVDDLYQWSVQVRHGGIPKSLGFLRQGLGTSMLSWVGVGDFEVGDPAFDGSVEVMGDRDVICAVLTPEVREQLVKWVGEGAFVGQGHVGWKVGDLERGPKVVAALRPLVKLANGLRHGDTSSRRRLVRNILRPDLPAVRRNNLKVLLETPSLRVTGRQLQEIIDALETDEADFTDALRDARAYQAEHHPKRWPLTPVTALVDMLDGSVAHKLAALPALGERGGQAEIAPVAALTSGLLVNGEVKAAARAAVGRLIARVGGEAGGLAVVEDTSGGLAVSE